MGNDPTILYVALGLVVIIYLVLGVLSFKTWRVLHALTAMAIFLASGYFVAMAGLYLKTEDVWRRMHDPLKMQVDELQLTVERLKNGIPLEEFTESKKSLTAEVAREILQRGRVWRGVVPGTLDDQTITADMSSWGSQRCNMLGIITETPAADDDADEGGQPQTVARPHNIEEKMVLYAFVETPIKDLGDDDDDSRNILQTALFGDSDLVVRDTQGYCKVPTFFLGEFEVTSAELDRLTLTMTIPPDAMQIAMLEKRDVTWALYDAMPVDGHDVFVDGSKDEKGNEILVTMSEEAIRALVRPSPNSTEAATEHYENLIDQLLRDGTTAGDDDEPSNVRTLVRMTSNPNPSEEDQAVIDAFSAVDVPREEGSEEPFSFETPLYFDNQGLAVAPSIVQGSPTLAIPGREILLDSQIAQELIDHGWAEEISKVYVRPLRNFSLINQNHYAQMRRLDDRIAAVRDDTARLVEANRVVMALVVERNKEQERLIHDRDGFAVELAAIIAHVDKLQEQTREVRARIIALATFNREQAIRLAELSAQIEAAARASVTPSSDESASTSRPSS